MRDQRDPEKWLKQISFYTGILDHMAMKGISVKSIHCINYSGVLDVNGVEYHFLNLKRWQTFFPVRLIRYAKRLNPDAVVVHGLIFPFQVILLQYGLRKTLITAQHHAERAYHDVRAFIQRAADRYIAAYFFTSLGLASSWVERKQIRSVSKIHEVMEASSAFNLLDRQLSRKSTKVSGAPIYLWVGRLDENKNPILLARAFVRFAAEFPGARLYVIYQSYEQESQLKEIAEQSDNITLVGKVNHSELPFWYSSAEFIISTSYYEGSGISVCEAMSCGCVPVLTDIPSFRMMTDHGNVGLLYTPGNEVALVEALRKTISIDVSMESRKVIHQFSQKLSYNAIASKMINIIQRKINER
ncbi:MAG TPA: glycosyltransferase family 4 protein [Ohtaekwangia sp.]